MSFGAPNDPYSQPQQPGGYQQAPQGVPPQQGYGYPQQQGYPQQPGYPTGGPRLASMGRRLGARLIDAVLYSIVYAVLAGAGVSSLMSSAKSCDPNAADYNTCINDATQSFMGKIWGVIAILWIVTFLYEWLMVSLVGATLGKLLVGIRVVKADTGQKPGLGSSALRWVIPFVGSIVCGIGALLVYLSPFWDGSGRRQGWHDKAAGTLVVEK
ncbi:RDD family protein [Streptomyces sp. J2-1]|uniref:RDD family protein n=1 Tax=Streptomyces corallincola TaxID=2851888 RepID=UPI001C3811CF|nr:RDD family protein [Streptomyces corallincola]MBV2355793.1 RDD family protein [Streptomyces corallincola]